MLPALGVRSLITCARAGRPRRAWPGRRRPALLLLAALLAGLATPARAAAIDPPDEFVGPFASWLNVKTMFGAVGNGVADDTAAIQNAINALSATRSVVYLPEGTYKITATLTMKARMFVGFVGRDPGLTTIRWAGEDGGTMFWANGVARSYWGRITWDGAGRAGTGFAHQWNHAQYPAYAATALNHVDETFKDMDRCLVAGRAGGDYGWSDSEGLVLRGHFLRCAIAGISLRSFNALGWNVWDSEFVDNGYGITNDNGGNGSAEVYRSYFQNSARADIGMPGPVYMGVRGNLSIGSNQFFHAADAGDNGGPVTFQDNKIFNTRNPVAIEVRNLGPVVLVGNTIRSPQDATAPAVLMKTIPSYPHSPDLWDIGGSYTVRTPIAVQGSGARWWSQEAGIHGYGSMPTPTPVVYNAAPNRSRQVVEVPFGASAATIQAAIDQAAQGQYGVVHIPAGQYQIDTTLTVPANTSIQLLGDAQATRLYWSGRDDDGPVLLLKGPSKAVISQIQLNGDLRANGLVIENADQVGARVLAWGGQIEQGISQAGLVADGLANTRVEWHGGNLDADNAPVAKVIGAPGGTGAVVIFGSDTSNVNTRGRLFEVSNGGRLLLADSWYEGSAPQLFKLTDDATVTLSNTVAAFYPSAAMKPLAELTGFTGKLAMVGGMITAMDYNSNRRMVVQGGASSTQALIAGMQIEGISDPLDLAGSGSAVSFLNNHLYQGGVGATQLADQGAARTSAFISSMLGQLRSTKPNAGGALAKGVTQVKLEFMRMLRGSVAIQVLPGPYDPKRR